MNITDLVLNNGASPSVPTPFVPLISQNGNNPAQWISRNVSARIGDKIVSQLVEYNPTTKKRKVRIKLSVPEVKLVGVDAMPSIVGTAFAELIVTIPEGMSTASIDDVAAFVKNVAAHKVIQDAIKLGEIAY